MSEYIKFGKLHSDAVIPTYATKGAGWADMYACFDEYERVIPPHECVLIPTGLCSEFPKGYRLGLYERGSNSKSNMQIMCGKIDSDYRKEIFVAVYNGNDIPLEITKGVVSVEITPDFVRVPYNRAICQVAVEIVPDIEIIEGNVGLMVRRESERKGAEALGSTGA